MTETQTEKAQIKPKILVTGGTGFLGQNLVPLLRERFDVHVLSRSSKTEIRGDLCQWNAGLDLEKLKQKKFDIFLHMAGLYELTASTADCYQQNIGATGTALKVADALGIPVFMNTSSVAVAINSDKPVVSGRDLNFSRPFPDAYAESKARAEEVLRYWPGDFRLRLNLRLGVLVGATGSGKILRIDGPYHAPVVLQRLQKFIENFPAALPLPGKKQGSLPLVPVDVASRAIVDLCSWSLRDSSPEMTPANGYQSLHLVPSEGLAIEDFYRSALEFLNIRYRDLRLIDGLADVFIKPLAKFALRFPQEELNYLLRFPLYETSQVREILGDNWCPEFREYEKKFWSGYAHYVSHR